MTLYKFERKKWIHSSQIMFMHWYNTVGQWLRWKCVWEWMPIFTHSTFFRQLYYVTCSLVAGEGLNRRQYQLDFKPTRKTCLILFPEILFSCDRKSVDIKTEVCPLQTTNILMHVIHLIFLFFLFSKLRTLYNELTKGCWYFYLCMIMTQYHCMSLTVFIQNGHMNSPPIGVAEETRPIAMLLEEQGSFRYRLDATKPTGKKSAGKGPWMSCMLTGTLWT